MARYSSMSPEELVRACAGSDDGAAWDEFVSRFRRPISLSILRVSRQWRDVSGTLVDDLAQETYLKLCADKCIRLLEFTALHPEATLGYIKTVAANVAHDYFKSEYSGKRGAGQARESLTDVTRLSRGEKRNAAESIERKVLLAQIEQFVQKCSAGPEQDRDQMLFWLHYRLGMTAKSIAALPTVGLTAKGVESVIFRLTRLVREHLMARDLRLSSGAEEAPKGC